jgi:hypothetical protein
VDAVSSMSSSCSAIVDSTTTSGKLHGLLQLLSDSALSWMLISLNSLTMMTQAIIYSVALNIGRNELVALMIATSFMEVKVRRSICWPAEFSAVHRSVRVMNSHCETAPSAGGCVQAL